MLCRTRRDHIEAFQNHGCYLPLLNDAQNWTHIVTSGPCHPAVAPAPSLASIQNALAERMGSAHRHAGRCCKRKSPDHFVPVSRSYVEAFKSLQTFDLYLVIES